MYHRADWRFFTWIVVFGIFANAGLIANRSRAEDAKTEESAAWKSLFDGDTLLGWRVTEFGGEGEVLVRDQAIQMDFGSSLTGITYDGKEFPQSNYEVRLEAQRVDGNDFFCGLTFPVQQNFCSLIVRGWGGTVVGLSSIDGADASENETRKSRTFRKGTWYRIQVRVTDDRIEAWIDDEKVVDQELAERAISIRPEVSLSKPLGICAWQTRAALRKIEWRKVP